MAKDKETPENKSNEPQEENELCTSNVTQALLKIQRENLVAMGKLLVKIGTMIDKLDNIEEKISEDDKTSTYLRFIGFLIIVNATLAGIQVGQIVGFWKFLFG